MKKTLIVAMSEIGWEPYNTGGGCMAYIKESPDGSHILITDIEGCDMPTTLLEPVWVGTYDAEGDLTGPEYTLNGVPTCSRYDALSDAIQDISAVNLHMVMDTEG